MISLSFIATLPLFIAAIVIFGYGVARRDQQASRKTMILLQDTGPMCRTSSNSQKHTAP